MEHKIEYCDYCRRVCVSVYSEKQSSWSHVMQMWKYYWMYHIETKQIFLAYFCDKADGTPVLKMFDTTEPDGDNEFDFHKDPLTVADVRKINWSAWQIRNYRKPRFR